MRAPAFFGSTMLLESLNEGVPTFLKDGICPKEALAKHLHCPSPSAFCLREEYVQPAQQMSSLSGEVCRLSLPLPAPTPTPVQV